MKLLPASLARSKKKMLVASVALLSVGLGSTVATGAWFTDSKQVLSNQLVAGTVVIGNIFDNNSSTPVSFTNVIPVADADVATKAQTFNVNVVNNGTTAINWAAKIFPSSTSNTTFGKQISVQYTLDGGKTWSTTTDATAVGAIRSTAALAAGTTQTIQFRAWLPATTDNTAQGKTYNFDVLVGGIQSNGGTTLPGF